MYGCRRRLLAVAFGQDRRASQRRRDQWFDRGSCLLGFRPQPLPLTLALAKVAMPVWQATAARASWIATAAPDASPRRMPRSSSGGRPIRFSSRRCPGSAEQWPDLAVVDGRGLDRLQHGRRARWR